MNDDEFDRALVSAAFTLAGDRGWPEVSVVRAARAGDLPLDRARGRFLGRGHILARFGRIADQTALALVTNEGTSRDRLFDLLMRRFDVLQAHRGGVLALKTFLPREPLLTLSLGAAHLVSMAFMLEAAGISASGCRGMLRAKGLVAVWLRAARAWERDESEDLAATMAAVDSGLDRAASVERWMKWDGAEPTGAPEPPLASPPPDIEPDFPPPPPPPPPEGADGANSPPV
jgi:hypothetical protein